ncbi:MAG: translocation/assembly module TamB domain-containing protein [Acidobacteria bacterium]|nr:translocation/assembly module TamB domain-containing protein [Acidobacteriota bacterium]
MAPENETAESGRDQKPVPEATTPRRRGRGCLHGIFRTTRTTFVIVLILLGAGWYWLEDGSIGEFLADKISSTLEEGLGRDVAVGRVSIRPTIPPRIIVRDIRIANLPGASSPEFARIGRIDVTGIIRSIVERRVDLGTIRVQDVFVSIEKMPAAAGGGFNVPTWASKEDSEPPNVDVRRLLLRNIAVEFVDRDAKTRIALDGVESEIRPGKLLESIHAVVKRGEFRVASGKIKLPPLQVAADLKADKRGIAIATLSAKNQLLELGARGNASFEKDGAVDLAADVRADLARLSGPIGLPRGKTMDGRVVSSFTIQGRESIEVAGTFHSGSARYDIYKVQKVDGHFRVGEAGMEVALDKAQFAGGAAKVSLAIPSGDADNVFSVEHDGVRVEQLLGTWGIGSSGLMGHADGRLVYRWRGKDVLNGRGEGNALIEVERDRKTKAIYAVPVEGMARYRFEERRLIFDPLTIETGSTSATIRGGFALESLDSSLVAEVRARDIRELDRIAADIAHSLGEKDWKLLGIAGSGTIRATLDGKLTKPVVDGKVAASGFHWADVELGHADVDLRYDAVAGLIHFRKANFRADGGSITLRDNIVLSPGGEPSFSLSIDAVRYPARRAIDAIALDLPVNGVATGGMRVTGKPSRGSVLFESLEVVDGSSHAGIDGVLGWTPEKGGLELECRIALRSFPVSKAWAFYAADSKPPLDGNLTGTMSLDGKLEALRGRGSIALRGAKLAGEPIESASIDFDFDQGSMHARRIVAQLAAGRFEGEGTYEIAAERFEFSIGSPGIDLSKLKGWPDLDDTVGGILVLSAHGSGDIGHPQIIVNARLEQAKLLGVEAVPTDPPSSIAAKLTRDAFEVSAKLGTLLQLNGSGTIAADTGEIGGALRATIDAGSPLIADMSTRYGLETSGSATIEIEIAGNRNAPNELALVGRLTDVDVTAGPHRIQSPKPATFSLRGGKLDLGNFDLLFDEKPFRVDGTVSISDNSLAVSLDGTLSAGLLAYVVPDLRMRGDIKLVATVGGSLDDPRVFGSAEMTGGEIRIRDIPQPFKDVNLAVVVTDRRVKIDAFNATLGTGSIAAGGTIDRDASGEPRLSISVTSRGFSARLTPDLTIGGTCDLVVSGNPVEALNVNGALTLDKALFTKKVDINKALADLVLNRRLAVDAIAAPWQEAILLGIDVRLTPRSIQVRNNVANVTGSGELRVTGTLARPVVVGRIVLDEGGTFELSDVEYRVARGSVDFQNPFRTDPYIDISAEGRYRNEYDVTVSFNGTLDRLETTVTSDPPVDDLSLLSLIGGGFAQGSGSQADAFADARNTLVDASVGGVLSSTVPFADAVRIEGISSEKPRVTLDKAISRDLRAIVTYTLDDKGEDVEIIEWRVSDNLVLQFTRDSTKESTFLINAIDLTFRRRFSGQW